MTFRVVPFEPEHLGSLRLQHGQAHAEHLIDQIQAARVDMGIAFTAMTAGGGPSAGVAAHARTVACAGVVPMWQGRDLAWSMLSECGPHTFLRIHRAAARFLDRRKTRRTEMWVYSTFAAGHRWALLLGFHRECRMRGFAPDGNDMDLYARIRDV